MREPRQPYSEPRLKKKGVSLPPDVEAAWNAQLVYVGHEEWLGAAILWMAAKKRYPRLCEAAFRAGRSKKPATAIAEIEEKLTTLATDDIVERWLATLSLEERAKIVTQIRSKS